MKLIPAIAVVALCLAINPAVKPDQHANETKAASNSEREPSTVIFNDQGTANRTYSESQERPKWYRAINWSNWALVIVALFTAYAVWEQAMETAKAAKASSEAANAAKASADAALLNAKSLMTSERPWVLIDFDDYAPNIRPPNLYTYAINRPAANCVFFLKNFGRTPAKILWFKAVLNIGDIPTTLPDFNDATSDIIKQDGFILPQGESWPGEARLPTAYISEEDLKAIFGKIKYLSMSGIIRYVDTFERPENQEPFTTEFCYFLETRTNATDSYWQIVPAPGCNRAT